MRTWWQFWKSTGGADRYETHLSAEPVSETRRMLLWMGPDELGMLKQAADVQGNVDVATPDGGGSMFSVSKADLDWAIRVDRLAEPASRAAQKRQHKEAIRHYLDALAEASGSDIYLMSVGSCFAMLGDKENALRFLRRAHEINPRNQQIAGNLKKCQMI